ncbi:C3 and PZP-like alpha-2-macroglobulin domain-containing protein 8 [Styela clava]
MNIVGGRRVRLELLLSLILLLFISNISSQKPSSQRGYLILAPAIFRSGVNQTISIRIFGEHEPVPVKATIVDWRGQSIITSEISSIKDNGVITFQIPKGIEGKAMLEVCGNCHQHATFRFQNSTTITIINKGTSAFIQTDKPLYKPSQRVNINVYTIDRDLRPVSDNVTIYLKGPSDVKIIEWRDLTPACCGTVNVSFPLSDQPLLGEWTVFAELQGNLYNTTFEVGKYVLPKFDVTITPPTTFRDFSICEEAIVTAKYTFGKPVRGTLHVNMTVTGLGYFVRDLDRGNTIVQSMPFHGESRFAICLQDNLRRRVLNRHFRGNLAIWATVISDDGSSFSAYDDTTIVSRNFVELEFTANTRKHFKHGIPFKGQIFASYLNGTGAKDILIELKVKDNQETFMTQELISPTDGIITFTIPALPQTTKFLWLEARAIAIDGAYTDRHQYLAVYHDLYSWHSPSECHLLIESPDEYLQVNQHTSIMVKSTCTCDFTLYYEFLSRGEIVLSDSFQVNDSNSHRIEERRRRSANFKRPIEHKKRHAEMGLCHTSIQFIPTANMGPLSKLVAYYVLPTGEGIADSIHLPIESILENEVTISTSKTQLAPGQSVDVTIKTTKDTCVCFGATDKSLHLISPGYLLTKDEIFEEIYSYDMDNLPFEDEGFRPSKLGRRRKRSAHGRQQLTSRDSLYAFLETGLVVMTDVVTLKHKQDVQVFSQLSRQALMQSPPAKIKSRKRRKLRSFFPETWYWKCFTVSSSGENTITLKVPDTVTSWVLNAVGTNPNNGMGVAENIEIQAVKPFFVDFNLPYSAIRGENMEVPVTLHNYLDVCTEVRLTFAVPAGATLEGETSDRASKKTKYLCIDRQSSLVTKFKVGFSNLGSSKILAVADAMGGPNRCCNADNRMIAKWKETDTINIDLTEENVVGNDALIKSILVEPEGDLREYTHSVFFCPNERLNITTQPGTTHFVKFPNKKSGFNFMTKAQSSVHIALTTDEEISVSSYEIILGGQGNMISWIQKNGEILASTSTKNILRDKEFRSFWVQWSPTNITVGYGMEESEVSQFLFLKIENINVKYVGLATNGQSAAEFRLWSTGDHPEGSFREVFQLDVPSYAVSGSIRGHATVIGDVMGPTLRNLNNLLKLPYGCGEQNMINFAPNIYVMKYLKLTNQLTGDIKNQALEYLVQGYQRQLTYRRRSGSYSAFGERDHYGSMWLTAFVLKSYAAAREFIFIDEKEILKPMNWILNHQLDDGSFPAYGKILNKDAQGGNNRKVALTAYVVIALLETEADNQKREESIAKALNYLEGMFYSYEDPYTAALTAYALTLGKSPFADEARMILMDMSIQTMTGSYRHWSLKGHVDVADIHPDDALFKMLGDSVKQTVASAEIELASYALLAFTLTQDVPSALPIVKWISKQRNAQGGFISTQDTCTALQALSSYATYSYIGGIHLNVTLEGPDYAWNVILNDTNSEILQRGEIPPLGPTPIPVFLNASGDGCALLQIHVLYNIPKPDDKKEFALSVVMANNLENINPSSILKKKRDSGEPVRPALVEIRSNTESAVLEEDTDLEKIAHMKICGRWLNDGSSNMAVLEVPLLTGYVPDTESLNEALSNRSRSLKRYEVENSKIVFYFDEISSVCKTCVTFRIQREVDVENLSSKIVKIYDYYEPGYESSLEYNQHEEGEVYTIEHDDRFPECKCYQECGYQGPRVCGNDGVMYENLCRMQVTSCETHKSINQEIDSFCEERGMSVTLEPPLEVPDEPYIHEYEPGVNYSDFLYVNPEDYFVDKTFSYDNY